MYVSYPPINKSLKSKVPWLVKSIPLLCLVVAEASEMLMSKRLSNKIIVNFEFCYYPNEVTEACIDSPMEERPREFTMILNVAKFKEPWEMLLAAIHETVHIKQFARGELYQYAKKWRTYRWKNKEFPLHRDNRPLPIKEAADMPWEIEAYGSEQELFIAILKKITHETGLTHLLADR